MLSTTNTEQLFGLACSGNIKALEDYWNGEGDLNVTYQKFGKEHSLIMGAFRNQQYDMVRWLKNHGCRLTHEEQDEINMEDIGGGKMVKAYVPLAEMFGYSTDLRSRTQGRGNYSMFFEKYEPVPKSIQEKVLNNKDK